jgi:hypothetical protein
MSSIPWTTVAVFAAGADTAVWLHARDTARYQTLGGVVVDEA